jgi:hypothetical protein
MNVTRLIGLCTRFYSILDNEWIEAFIRREAGKDTSEKSIDLLYYSYRANTKAWADLAHDRLTLNVRKTQILDNFMITDELISELSRIVSDIEKDNGRPLERRVLDSILDRGPIAETLAAEYAILLAELCKRE